MRMTKYYRRRDADDTGYRQLETSGMPLHALQPVCRMMLYSSQMAADQPLSSCPCSWQGHIASSGRPIQQACDLYSPQSGSTSA